MKPSDYFIKVIVSYINKNIDYIVTEVPFNVDSNIVQVDQFLVYLCESYNVVTIRELKKLLNKQDLYDIYLKMPVDFNPKNQWIILNDITKKS